MTTKNFNELSLDELLILKNSTEKATDSTINTVGELQSLYNSQKCIIQRSETTYKGKNLLLD